MKKRLVELLLLFVVITGIVYTQAAFEKPKPVKTTPVKNQEEQLVNALPYTKIKGNTYSQLVGKSKGNLLKNLGKPKEEITLTDKLTYLDYGNEFNHFLKVVVENNQVTEIFSLGAKDKNAPFEMGMDEAKLSKITPLSGSFDLSSLDFPLSFELTEEDLNYQPLVAFDNDTFGIFYFDPSENQLLGIHYLTKEQLQQQMPYEVLLEGETPQKTPFPKEKVEAFNQLKSTLYRQTIDVLRQKMDLPTLGNLYVNDQVAKNALVKLVQQPQKYLDKEDLAEYEKQKTAKASFQIENQDFHQLSKKLALKDVKQGFIHYPVELPISKALEDFMFSPLKGMYHKEQQGIFAVAFHEDYMIVLLSEKKITTESS